jgi:hypothetical protein
VNVLQSCRKCLVSRLIVQVVLEGFHFSGKRVYQAIGSSLMDNSLATNSI